MTALRRHCALVSTTAAIACGATAAFAQTYDTFEIQARSNIADGFNLPALSSFNSKTPALNNDGTIAFSLIVVGGGPAGIFVGADGIGSVVHSAPGELLFSDTSINQHGDVCFELFDVFSEGIYVYDSKTELVTLEVPATFNTSSAEMIDDDGNIGFRAGEFSGNAWVVSSIDSPGLTTYVEESGNIAFLFTPAFNGTHGIGGKVRLDSTSNDAPDEIRLYSAPGTYTVMAQDDDADPKSPYSGFDNSIALTSDGRVAFIASLAGGGRGVFITDGTTTTTIATTDDAMVNSISFFKPAANANGLVAFRGTDNDGLDAIFAGDGNTLTRVIGEHDTVTIDLGLARIDQHDNSVTFGGAPAMNEHGDIAFNATLTPADNNQIEWGSGMFIAYADNAVLGDIDGNGTVDVDDLLALLAAWGPCDKDCPEDLDGDGTVNVDDLLTLLAAWTG